MPFDVGPKLLGTHSLLGVSEELPGPQLSKSRRFGRTKATNSQNLMLGLAPTAVAALIMCVGASCHLSTSLAVVHPQLLCWKKMHNYLLTHLPQRWLHQDSRILMAGKSQDDSSQFSGEYVA